MERWTNALPGPISDGPDDPPLDQDIKPDRGLPKGPKKPTDGKS